MSKNRLVWRVQPVRHIISRKHRHREMQERADQFRTMLDNEIKRQDKERKIYYESCFANRKID